MVTWTISTALFPTARLLGLDPVWVFPSMVTGLVMGGRRETSVIVWGPAPGMAKLMLSAPAVALASVMACRRLPAPESAVVVTLKMAPGPVPR